MAVKVTVQYSGRRHDPGDEYQNRCVVLLDGVEIASGSNFSECPEDANLGRGLKFVYRLPEVLRQVHAAGQAGDRFELEEIENCASEEWLVESYVYFAESPIQD
jgi:hypothetical protein